MKTTKICINCPAGCHLEITQKQTGEILVTGNSCPRGKKYAEQELTDPRRVVTAVVLADSEKRCCIPVKTSQALPMALIPGLLRELSGMKIKLPVKMGEILLKDYENTGIDIVVTGESTGKLQKYKRLLEFNKFNS